ncbi:MAG: hypothetical protein ACREHE_13400 [Rhizomicrobium sp.]
MTKLNMMGLFCEDIREEKNDMFTLVGLFQDNVEIGFEVGIAPKICGYFRFSFPTETPLPPFKIVMTFPDGESAEIGNVEQDVIDKAVRETKAQGGPIATVISRAILTGLRVTLGRLVVTANIAGEEHILAALNFVLAPDAKPSPSA